MRHGDDRRAAVKPRPTGRVRRILELAPDDDRHPRTHSSHVIATTHGDLILDAQLRGNVYHNGVLLTNSTAGDAFLFAYDFARASTCRDRHRLASCRDAARQAQEIWEEALRIQEETILPVFLDLLRSHAYSADAQLVGSLLEPSTATCCANQRRSNSFTARRAMTRCVLGTDPSTLRLLMQTDREHNPGQPQPGTPARHAVDHAGCLLPHPNRRGRAARTGQGCDTLRYPRYNICENNQPSFAGLSCLLTFTDHTQVVYVKGMAGNADLYFDRGRGTLKIHHRWLNYASTHRRSFCQSWSPSSLADTNSTFFCSHVVEELLVRSIGSLFKAHAASRPVDINFVREIGRRLRYLPRSINLKPYPGDILVSWEDNETKAFRTLWPGGPDYHVVLHEGNCTSVETALLYEKAGKWSSVVQGPTAKVVL